jgi:hypothetical protein
VSLRWRDEVSIYVGPRRVALARRPRGLRTRTTASVDVPVTDGQVTNGAPTLATLARLLQDAAWRDANARVIVDDAWARYVLVPWSGAWVAAADRTAQARLALEGAFGGALDGWRVAVDEAAVERPSLGCALRPDVVDALPAILADVRLRLTSLRPQLAVTFNAWRHALPERAWFVSVGDDALTAVHVSEGRWDSVNSARAGADWARDLERLQAFGQLTRNDDPETRTFVDAPRWLRDRAPRGAGVEWLDGGPVPPGDADDLALLQRSFA